MAQPPTTKPTLTPTAEYSIWMTQGSVVPQYDKADDNLLCLHLFVSLVPSSEVNDAVVSTMGAGVVVESMSRAFVTLVSTVQKQANITL